jgi:hypothetical protein
MKTKMDVNSVVNQDIKRKFVDNEVMACFSYEMEAILKASSNWSDKDNPLPTFDEIENLYEYVCPHCNEELPETDELKPGSVKEYECPHCKEEFSDADSQPQEIFEWWIVSDFLYRKLKEQNEPVLEWGNNYYWGRGTSGQAIMLDGVISTICKEMEILDGQKYSWAKKG